MPDACMRAGRSAHLMPHCNIGFGESQHSLRMNGSVREQHLHLRFFQQTKFSQSAQGFFSGLFSGDVAKRKPPDEQQSQRKRQPMENGEQEMRFKGKKETGGLYEVFPANASHLVGHSLLVRVGSHVFDDGVRKHNINRLIRERVKIARVSHNGSEIRMPDSDLIEVQENDLVWGVGKSHHFPEFLPAPEVEDGDGAVVDRRNQILKQNKSSPSERSRQRI